jgi:hypothetical protein
MKVLAAPRPAPTRPARRHHRSAVLALAGCGGSPSSTGGSPHAGGSVSSPSAVGFSRYMGTHGVPNYPDPDSSGALRKTGAQQLGVTSSEFNGAQRACQPLLPSTWPMSFEQQVQQCYQAGDCPQAVVQQILTVQRKFARCIRSHGLPNFPDPTIDSQLRPVFDLSGAGIDPQSADSSQFRSNECECRRLVGGSVPILPFT